MKIQLLEIQIREKAAQSQRISRRSRCYEIEHELIEDELVGLAEKYEALCGSEELEDLMFELSE